MLKIFVSYRRSDSEERAHRIADWLVLKYGRENVFIDVDRIGGGEDFVDVIEQSLAASDVLLVIIGDQWVDELENRSKSPNIDFVRFEVAYGLKNIPLLIPVLTHHGVAIDKNRLPDDTQALLQYNFMYARLSDFHQDMERIRERFPVPEPEKPKYNVPVLAAVFVAIGIVAGLLLMLISNGTIGIHSATETPANPQTAAAMTLTAQALPTVTDTPNEPATINAILTELVQTETAIAQASNDAYATETTIVMAETQAAETNAAQALTDEASTQIAQLTDNAPTNTALPTDTHTARPSATSTINQTETAQAEINATATQLAVHTQAVQTAVAINNARQTQTAQAISDSFTAFADEKVLVVRREPNISADIIGTVPTNGIVEILNYVITEDENRKYWVQISRNNAEGYVWLSVFSSASQLQIVNAASAGYIPTINWDR
jgi:hypothetical protein